MTTTILWQTTKEIEPCQCGAIERLYVKPVNFETLKRGSFVYCINCGRHGPVRKQPIVAITAWNKEAKSRRKP